MEGEPPLYPIRKFDYKEEWLHKGFARIGLPATGDHRLGWWRECGITVYGNVWLNDDKIRNHEQFALIEVGDIILIPTGLRRYQVHLGVAKPPRMGVNLAAPHRAYYYFYNIASGDWYENAHRIDVEWAKSGNEFQAFDIPEIGGTWLRSFGPVKAGRMLSEQLAKGSGLYNSKKT